MGPSEHARIGSRSRTALCAVGTVLAAVAACDASAHSDQEPTSRLAQPSVTSSTRATSSTPNSTEQAKKAALTAYRGMWRAFVEAGHTSDWQSPALAKYATGVALTNLTRSLYADHYNGVVTKGKPVLHPRVSSVDPQYDPTKVVITDCGDSTDWLKYRADTGERVEDGASGNRLINATVEKQPNGSWKVSDFGVHEVGSC